MVPEGWSKQTFSSITQIGNGQVDPKAEPYASMKHIGPENVVSNTGRLINVKRCSELGLISGKYEFDENAIVYSKIRPHLNKVCKPEFKGVCSADMYPIWANEDLNVDYLFHYMLGPSFYKIAVSMSMRTGMPKINRADLNAVSILVPPLSEQGIIARTLSTWDKAIETVEKLIENSQAQKKALMQQLLTGKRRLPEFHGDWKIVQLGHVLNEKKRKGKIVPTNEERRGVAYIGSTSFDGNFGIYTDSPNAIICSPKNILVLWDGENAGKVTTGLSGAVSSTVVRYSINESKANNHFITYNLLNDNDKIRAIREGSGIPHIPGNFEKWYHIDLPPLKEQQKISFILTTADKKIESLQQKLDCLKQEKKALMQQLLTGKRRVKVNEDDLQGEVV